MRPGAASFMRSTSAAPFRPGSALRSAAAATASWRRTMSSASVALSSMATRLGSSNSPASLARAPRAAARVAGSGSAARAKTRSISPRAPFSPRMSMRTALAGWGVVSMRPRGLGDDVLGLEPEQFRFQGRGLLFVGAVEELEEQRDYRRGARTGWRPAGRSCRGRGGSRGQRGWPSRRRAGRASRRSPPARRAPRPWPFRSNGPSPRRSRALSPCRGRSHAGRPPGCRPPSTDREARRL